MDIESYLRFVLALVFVLALIFLLALVARRYGLGYRTRIRKGGVRRLSIAEIMPLDAKRRLVLVRRDDREHLILLGIDGDLVVERNIPGGDDDTRTDDFKAVLAESTPPVDDRDKSTQ